ncbi:acetyl/propionyl/methylcrotonyl-CoA carboxylase subunit alpha [Carboxylicivirga marina]|uniref:acetyl/propionyl/methylcrotonyl-CoA carboxylase subunit alpha n=1 Tax=Carboxylicivirga marina TaxID=2800988 RepID=UPI002593D389|nr:biotin carboxylase N-terminal domain-containing protein [uncultured Carboxylicivirga sp.]
MKKVLIPNRGEIALRIIKAAHQLGLKTVVTLLPLEKDTLAAQLSDEVHFFQEGSFKDNYLNITLIIELAQQYNADCTHPGYGFLSENHQLAEACKEAGILFIGPSAENLKQMGDKQIARTIAQKANVPLTQSWEGNLQSILSKADTLPFPVLVKAAMGGGGKGMQICHSKDELLLHLPRLSKQAQRYFGDERIYVEQYIEKARHIEVQVLADKHENTVHLFERECSVQRRFQKIIEEAPAFNLPSELKDRLYKDALSICHTINYENAGTVEFIVDEHGNHYFLEMNTRIQVEHCVSEEITGIDLVEWQFKIADNKALTFNQEDLSINGHAIELRICAEDPHNNFQPTPGPIQSLTLPNSKSIRLEIGFDKPMAIHSQFDPMIAKLIVHGSSRNIAIQKAKEANEQLLVRGIKTNASFINSVLGHQRFTEGNVSTRFCEEQLQNLLSTSPPDIEKYSIAYAVYRHIGLKNRFWRQIQNLDFTIAGDVYSAQFKQHGKDLRIELNEQSFTISNISLTKHELMFELNKQTFNFFCFEQEHTIELIHQLKSVVVKANDWLPPYNPREKEEDHSSIDSFLAPIPSQVMKVNVSIGQKVKKGDLLLILEAMKTENHIKAWKDGIIEKVHIQAGEQVKLNQTLLAYQTNIRE